MFVHPLEALDRAARVSAIVVVLPEERPDFVDEHLSKEKICSIANGGASRQVSLGQGLECLPEETTVVLVHDAARPLLDRRLIDRVLDGFDGSFHGVISAIPMDDSIKEVSDAREILSARARRSLWRAQTPQAFLRDSLEDALARADAEGIDCDDCSELLTRAGYRVKVVEGDPWNLKVTRPKDVSLAEAILAARADAKRLGASQ
jgi:2-C-methyl-D-erythritol 4-phosphate cytidylyltransferase